MKELKLYTCEFCGTNYKEKTICMQCEKTHKKPVKIKSSRYIPDKNNNKGYPISLEIEMEDGKTVTYKR